MSKAPEGDRFEHLEFEEPLSLSGQEEEHSLQHLPTVRPGEGLLSAEPMETHAYHDRAVQAFQRGDFEKALRYDTRALELDRKHVPAWVGQVQMLIELNELHEADLWADKALELFRDNGELLSAKAVARARLGRSSDALQCSDAGMRSRGSSAYRWLARGEVLLARQEERIESCFDRAAAEPDADWFTRIWTARIYYHYRRYTSALIAARAGVDMAPHAPFAWYVRGLCERELAMASYRQSLERALEIDGTFNLARAALRQPARGSWVARWVRRMRGR